MKVAVANDHAGVGLRGAVLACLADLGATVVDVGSDRSDPVDFPLVTERATELVLAQEVDRAILLCGTGAGACMAANKFAGIRAAVAHDVYVARQCVEHDDANVLCIGAWIVGPRIAEEVVRAFLGARFGTGDDVRRRVRQLGDIERRRPPP